MTFLIPCPVCGPREATEFSYGGEASSRPRPDASDAELSSALFFRANEMGPQTEWWMHWSGCGSWFVAERDARTNEILSTRLPSERGAAPARATEAADARPTGGSEMA
jgi:sarcosine oxidase subunit delta